MVVCHRRNSMTYEDAMLGERRYNEFFNDLLRLSLIKDLDPESRPLP